MDAILNAVADYQCEAGNAGHYMARAEDFRRCPTTDWTRLYRTLMSGYASNNKYALLSGLRATAQSISYELPLALSLLPVALVNLLVTVALKLVFSLVFGG